MPVTARRFSLGPAMPGPAKDESELIADLERVLAAEKRYATRLQERGDFGQAKLALAAIDGMKAALEAVTPQAPLPLAQRLERALAEERAAYSNLWDDEDGIGTSTFSRVQRLI